VSNKAVYLLKREIVILLVNPLLKGLRFLLVWCPKRGNLLAAGAVDTPKCSAPQNQFPARGILARKLLHDPIFDSLTPAQQLQICNLMSFDPLVSPKHRLRLSGCSEAYSLEWLKNSCVVEEEIRRLGSWTFGKEKSYDEIVRDLAKNFGVSSPLGTLPFVEQALISKLWSDTLGKLTPAQLEELNVKVQAISEGYGPGFGKEILGAAALTVGNASGFGIYLLGSTVLGALNGALGLGLGFGAFTGLSSVIAAIIGPLGWGALGVSVGAKVGKRMTGPNYKKLLPVVIYIAVQRALLEQKQRSPSRFRRFTNWLKEAMAEDFASSGLSQRQR
jgi:uncharacterized protein YaaW (UPF0174 family)